MSRLRFLGHACFYLNDSDTELLFDPFLSANPFQKEQPSQISCNFILVSHAHFDHLGDTIDIAKRTSATIISTAEIANLCEKDGCNVHAMHIGGKHRFKFGYVRITPAFHGAGIEGGHACGFIVNFKGKKIYFSGDTSLFGDMELLGRLETIDYALLPIGDNFTMGPEDAVEAVGLLKPKAVIPMHYNTWPLIAQAPEHFKNTVENRFNIPVHVLQPGDSIEF